MGNNRRSADPFVDPDVDRVSCLLADGGSQRGLYWQPVRTVALRHECACERFAVDHTTNLDQTPGTEKLMHIVDNNARPGTGVVSLLKGRVELFQHRARVSQAGDLGWQVRLSAFALQAIHTATIALATYRPSPRGALFGVRAARSRSKFRDRCRQFVDLSLKAGDLASNSNPCLLDAGSPIVRHF